MSTIKEMERLSNQQLETVKRRQDRQIKALEDHHQKYKAELKKAQGNEVVDLQDEHHRQLSREAEKKEKVLAEMRTHLQNSQRLTDKELKDLKEFSEAERAKLQQQLGTEREKVIGENQLHMEELAHRFQSEVRNINHEGQGQLTDLNRRMKAQYAEQQEQLQKKINDQNHDFTARFNRETMEHQKLIDQTQNRNKHERLSLNQRQQSDLAKMTEAQNRIVEQRDGEFRKGLKEQDEFYLKKYAVSQEAHNKDANALDERFHELMNKMKTDLAKEMTKTTERLDDPFYQFTELRPTWKHTEDGVEIKVKIPHYSKEDLRLTTNGKEAVLSFSRRYEDANKSQDGIKNKVNKVESFTSRINTGVILNAKTVTANYQDGEMIYTIKRA